VFALRHDWHLPARTRAGAFSNYKQSNRLPGPIKPAWPALALVATSNVPQSGV